MSLKVKITSTSNILWNGDAWSQIAWNLGMKKISSLVQIHAPTSSFKNQPIFIEFYEDSALPNNVSHNNDDSSNGHNNVPTANLCTLGKNVHDDHPNFSSLGCCSWKGMECDVVDVEGVFVAKGRIIACDPREVVLDLDLGDHVGILILYCLNDILVVISIWKWSLSQMIFHGHSLKAFLKSYEDNCIFDVDVERGIGVKKITMRKKKTLDADIPVLRIVKLLSEESIQFVRIVVYCSLNCFQYFSCKKTPLMI